MQNINHNSSLCFLKVFIVVLLVHNFKQSLVAFLMELRLVIWLLLIIERLEHMSRWLRVFDSFVGRSDLELSWCFVLQLI